MELTGCCKMGSGASSAVAEGSSAVLCVLRGVLWMGGDRTQGKERKENGSGFVNRHLARVADLRSRE